jgi:hypothetical protein
MKQFRLSKLSPGAMITKFHVYNSNGDTIGSINVPNEDADALERHWLGGTIQAQASALATSTRRKENAMVAEMLAAGQRSNTSAPAAAGPANRRTRWSARCCASLRSIG